MSFNELNKNIFVVSILIYVVGMMSVSLANIFGGYYCVVTAIESILLTMYISKLFEEKVSFKNNIIETLTVTIIVLFSLLFFVVNDIFGVQVYVKNSFGFWSVCVIMSQIISVLSVLYSLVNYVLKQNKEHVEILDVDRDTKENVNIEEKVEDVEEEAVVEKEEPDDEIEINIEENCSTEIRSITEFDFKDNVPFMEEEN